MRQEGDARRVLVVDDEALMNDFVKEILIRRDHEVDQAVDGDSAIQMLREREYDLVITDKKMPGTGGMEVLAASRKLRPEARVIMMTAYGTVDGAVDAMKQGAFDYIMKPFDADQIEEVVERALAGGGEELSPLKPSFDIVGKSGKIREVHELVRVVAPTSSTVLITGETGTGKELVAREIQRLSKRADRPFVRLNCAALPDGLMESELFGHEKGAFTGALRRKMGKFELADSGTMLLDEIGEIGMQMQAKVLRVLQEKEFERVGGDRIQKANVRIIATTNKDLKAEMEAGRFREDLYYRLSVFPIHLPSLREHKEDIPELVAYFIEKYHPVSKNDVRGIEETALEMLTAHDWPGNVRELENCIERALIIGKGPLITRDEIVPPASAARKDRPSLDPGVSLREMERVLVLKTLESVGWNRTMAARRLGITTRTLRNKLKLYKEEGIAPHTEKSSTSEIREGEPALAR
jgi:two-component system response regulator HydG